jgi:hypothetical protein
MDKEASGGVNIMIDKIMEKTIVYSNVCRYRKFKQSIIVCQVF